MESFFASLKTECTHHLHFSDRQTAEQEIFAYIETFYNRDRLHSSLGYLTPLEFEQQHPQIVLAA
jgi:transposase InsO family protein